MNDRRIRDIAIVGGGTAGWMAAASLAKSLDGLGVQIRLMNPRTSAPSVWARRRFRLSWISSGNWASPRTTWFGTSKRPTSFGIGYRDWTRPGHFYFHPFGPTGPGIGAIPFQAYWLKMFLEGSAAPLEDYSIQAAAAIRGRFTRPVHAPNTPLNKIAYACTSMLRASRAICATLPKLAASTEPWGTCAASR